MSPMLFLLMASCSALGIAQSSENDASSPAILAEGCLVKSHTGDGYEIVNERYPKGVEVHLPDRYQGDAGYIVTVTVAAWREESPRSGPILGITGVTKIGKACAPTSINSSMVPMITLSGSEAVDRLLQSTPPAYPQLAKANKVTGKIVLRVVISGDGTIKDSMVIAGPVMLFQAALDSLKTWRYRPYIVNGVAVEVETIVEVPFSPSE